MWTTAAAVAFPTVSQAAACPRQQLAGSTTTTVDTQLGILSINKPLLLHVLILMHDFHSRTGVNPVAITRPAPSHTALISSMLYLLASAPPEGPAVDLHEAAASAVMAMSDLAVLVKSEQAWHQQQSQRTGEGTGSHRAALLPTPMFICTNSRSSTGAQQVADETSDFSASIAGTDAEAAADEALLAILEKRPLEDMSAISGQKSGQLAESPKEHEPYAVQLWRMVLYILQHPVLGCEADYSSSNARTGRDECTGICVQEDTAWLNPRTNLGQHDLGFKLFINN